MSVPWGGRTVPATKGLRSRVRGGRRPFGSRSLEHLLLSGHTSTARVEERSKEVGSPARSAHVGLQEWRLDVLARGFLAFAVGEGGRVVENQLLGVSCSCGVWLRLLWCSSSGEKARGLEWADALAAYPASIESGGRLRLDPKAELAFATSIFLGGFSDLAREMVLGVVGEARRVAKEARKRRKKAQRRQQQRKEKRAAALLLAPKTAAVVITLQPDAVQRGVTYGDNLAKLKGAMTPAEFGAPDGFSIKVTATGARLLEFPGAASSSSADALAEKLRACLGADEARVSRPTKCLDLRILGLDDSVTEHEVVAADARTGGCSVDQVKAGTIRPDNSGLRTVVVSCPVTAAKKIKEGRRLWWVGLGQGQLSRPGR
ncbi:hypothetical protein SFRURICE_008226 [Spodoptera frugiperda]|nr:hypothetical protein SFRURICE_008226 [Spodoptera frugiperda]